MKRFEVLITLQALSFLRSCKKAEQIRLEKRIDRLDQEYNSLSDCTEYDEIGRLINITLVGSHSIHYWIDSADEHVKILKIKNADR